MKSSEVAMVPLRDAGVTSVETFNSTSATLHRHAVIAADPRAAGGRWAYTAEPDRAS